MAFSHIIECWGFEVLSLSVKPDFEEYFNKIILCLLSFCVCTLSVLGGYFLHSSGKLRNLMKVFHNSVLF